MKNLKKYPNMRTVQAESAQILANHANRLLLIEAICLVFLVIPLYYAILSLCRMAMLCFASVPLVMWYWSAFATYFLLTLLLTLPLIRGLFEMAAKMENGEEVLLIDLFAPFRSIQAYLGAVYTAWRQIVIPTIMVLAISLSHYLAGELFVSRTMVSLVGYAAMALILIACVFALELRFTLTAREVAGEHMPHLYQYSAWARTRHSDRFLLAYLFRIFLGILSMGILLLWDVIPEMLIAYFRFCRHMNDNDDSIGGINQDE